MKTARSNYIVKGITSNVMMHTDYMLYVIYYTSTHKYTIDNNSQLL